jgi:hypothetical protein
MNEQTHDKAVVEVDEDDTDWETEARAEGWVPEGEWQGQPPKHGFMEAKEFVKRGKEVLPIIQAKNRRMEGELAALKTQLTDLQSTASRFNQFAQGAIDRERKEKQELIERLQNRRAQAISESDGSTVQEAERQIMQASRELEHFPQPQATPSQPAQYTREQLKPVEDFISANPWYQSDPDMRDWADARAVRLRTEGMNPGPAMLEKVALEARKVWAHKLQGNGSFVSTVETGGRRVPEQFGKRTFDDLPPDAKHAYDEFKRTNPKLTKTDYLNLYEWD